MNATCVQVLAMVGRGTPSYPLELGLQAAVRPLTEVLGTKLGSSGRAAIAPNSLPSLQPLASCQAFGENKNNEYTLPAVFQSLPTACPFPMSSYNYIFIWFINKALKNHGLLFFSYLA